MTGHKEGLNGAGTPPRPDDKSGSSQGYNTREPRDGFIVKYEQEAQALAFMKAVMSRGEVHEVRTPPILRGFYSDPALAAKAALDSDLDNAGREKPVSGVYVTLNSIDPDVAGNGLNAAPRWGKSAKAHDVLRWRHLLIDVDPIRQLTEEEQAALDGEKPKPMPSTDAELAAALEVRDRVHAELTAQGWPEPVAVTMSGNGGGLLYRVKLTGDPAVGSKLVGNALEALAGRFDTDDVKLDTGVTDAIRLTKVPGTHSRKGAATETRPHRMATAEVDAEAGAVTLEHLQALAGEVVNEPTEQAGEPNKAVAQPIRQALDAAGIGYAQTVNAKGTIRLALDRCPTGEHDKTSPTDTTLWVRVNGRTGFDCKHATCAGKTWQDAKAALGIESGSGADAQPSKASILREVVGGRGVELFMDELDRPWAVLPVKGHREVHRVDSRAVKSWLTYEFERDNGGTMPGNNALADVVNSMWSRAQFDGDVRDVHLRVAAHEGAVYLDLCNAEWEVVEVTKDGWRVVTDPPIAFHRSASMKALPTPTRGGSVDDLEGLINAKAGSDNFTLCVAWALGALLPGGPYPVLNAGGEPGAAKSSLIAFLRNLIDPNEAPLRPPPKKEDDLLVTALHQRVVTLDNVSTVEKWQSDLLCRLATGGGLAKRSLYTNGDEFVANVKRPIAMCGIGDLVLEPDLLDRALLIDVPTLDATSTKRLTESRLLGNWTDKHPGILGALLDAVVVGLRRRDEIEAAVLAGEKQLPRLADFAAWVMACEPELGWEPGPSWPLTDATETTPSSRRSKPHLSTHR